MTYEEEKIQFFACLGAALNAWGDVEIALYLIFLGCVSPANPEAAAAVYYATESFRTKLNITDAALQVVLRGQPELAAWTKLKAVVDRKSKKRNELAHNEVFDWPHGPEGKRWFLVKPLLKPRPKPQVTGLHINELNTRKLTFQAVAKRLREFHLTYGQGAPYYVPRRNDIRTRGVTDET